MKETVQLRERSTVHDRVAYKNVLLDNKVDLNQHANLLRNSIKLDDSADKVHFTTWRPFDTLDPLDAVLKLESQFPFTLASGSSLDQWEQRSEHGTINLFFNAIPLEARPEPSDEPTPDVTERLPFAEAREPTYEAHGWWCLVAWFPLGFALLATKRYYKVPWFLMHNIHNALGLLVTAATLYTCLEVYKHVDWLQQTSAHGILGLLALILAMFVGLTGLITASMMQWYTGDKPWQERDRHFQVARVHRYSSYFMLLLGNGVCSGGVATYFSKIGYGIWGTFGVSTSIFFLLMWGLHEYAMRKYNKRKFQLIEGIELKELLERQNGRVIKWTPS